jgi:hypothetical protein
MMKKTLALLALASAMPLAAQSFEVGALYTWNPGKSETINSGSGDIQLKADTWKAAGLRFGYNFFHNDMLEVQGNATIQFNNSQDINVSGGGSSAKLGTEDYKYWALGAAVNWTNMPVHVGVGLEYRSEKLAFADQVAPQYNGSTTYGRPWLRGMLGWNIPTGGPATPFIGAEAGFPLTSTSLSYADIAGSNPDIDKLNKSLAPKAQYGLYVGVRF